MAVTADRLLTGVKRRISMPASQVLLLDSDILQLADDVIKERVVPLLRSVRQDFFVRTTDTAFVEDQAEYDIPYRALGRTLRDLKLYDSSGNHRDIALVAIEDEQYFSNLGSPVGWGFYFKGDKIVIVPTPQDDTYGLQIWWELPPANLCKLEDAGTVTSFTATTVTFSSLPATFVIGAVVDFVQGISGNSTLAMDKTITNVNSTTITFAADVIPTDLAVGDYVSIAQTSPVIQLPNEAYPYLETLTCQRVLEAISDYEGLARLQEDEKIAEKNLKQILEPRAVGESTVFVNRTSLVRGARGRFLTSGYWF